MSTTNITTVTLERVAVETAMTVKMGMDVHAGDAVVCAQYGDQLPKPPRRLEPGVVVEMAGELVRRGAKVWSCYEAGPCGYTLHRQLSAVGVNNVVVVPRRWDPEGGQDSGGGSAQTEDGSAGRASAVRCAGPACAGQHDGI